MRHTRWVPVTIGLIVMCAVAEAQDEKAWEKPGTETGQEITGPAGIVLVWVPGGSFMMGSTQAEIQQVANTMGAERELIEDETPAHRVELDGFWIGKTEVTVGQWQSVMGSVPGSWNSQGGDHPVVEVSWGDCLAFCRRTALELPTEAQWEYAARGPQSRRYPWGDEWSADRLCWDGNCGPGETTFAVGSFPLGVSWCGALDMAGNVSEWCADWYAQGYYAASPPRDPTGPTTGQGRALRGGSWLDLQEGCRCAARMAGPPNDFRMPNFGFRVAVRCR